MIWAVVPAKIDEKSKERLAPVLSREQRLSLAEAMLSDVLGALAACPLVERTVVVSRSGAAAEIARRHGADILIEQAPGGLNRGVAEATRHCAAQGATAAVIAMGDLPLLRSEHVAAAVRRAPDRGLLLVPSADGTGTNLVVSRPADLLVPEFGPNSLARHLVEADRRRLERVVHECAGAALDVDTPADLDRLLALAPPGTSSVDLLRRARAEARVTGLA